MLKLIEKDEILNSTILNSLESFFVNDNILLDWNWFHEQAISHRIAYYLEYYFKCNNKNNNNVSFDCEYNKIWDSTWNIDIKKFIKKTSKTDNFKKYKLIFKDWEELDEDILKFYQEWNLYLFYTKKEKIISIWEIKDNNIIIKYKNLQNSQIRPDIIIHKRWSNLNNICVFEIKKWKLDSKDILKLKWFTSSNLNFQYKYWIWLSNFDKDKETVDISIYEYWELKTEFIYNNKEKNVWENIKFL